MRIHVLGGAVLNKFLIIFWVEIPRVKRIQILHVNLEIHFLFLELASIMLILISTGEILNTSDFLVVTNQLEFLCVFHVHEDLVAFPRDFANSHQILALALDLDHFTALNFLSYKNDFGIIHGDHVLLENLRVVLVPNASSDV